MTVVEAHSGRPADVRRLLSNFELIRDEHGFGAGVIRAMLVTSIERYDEALRALLSAADRGDPDFSFVWLEPQLQPLRRQPGSSEVSKWVPPPR